MPSLLLTCLFSVEYNLHLEQEEAIYNPEFRENHVHRTVRQAVDNTPVTENITTVVSTFEQPLFGARMAITHVL